MSQVQEIEIQGFELTDPHFGLVKAIRETQVWGFFRWPLGYELGLALHIRQHNKRSPVIIRLVSDVGFPANTQTQMQVHVRRASGRVTYVIPQRDGRMPHEHIVTGCKHLLENLSSTGGILTVTITITGGQ